jgi:hypothetical protein
MEIITDPEVLKRVCGIAAAAYFVSALALFFAAVKTQTLRYDTRIVAPILTTVAISLALVAFEFARASQPVLLILFPSVVVALGAAGVALPVIAFRQLRTRVARTVAVVAAPLPLIVCGILNLITYLLAHSRFCC